MLRKICLFLFCAFILTGCAQSMKQRANMLDAMSGRLTPVNYTQTYIFSTFGYPDSKTISAADDVTTEVWTYKTISGDKDLVFNMRPHKARYMKITIVNKIVTDVAFE